MAVAALASHALATVLARDAQRNATVRALVGGPIHFALIHAARSVAGGLGGVVVARAFVKVEDVVR